MNEIKTSEWFAKMYRELEGDPDYIAAGFAIEITDALAARAQEIGKTQADMAREAGMSRAQVSKIFSGEENVTLKTVAKLAATVGKKPVLSLRFM